ncbi:MAG: hypothetical protein KDA69_02915 [Planctomycetaceae bacterium]|nr:hypothetical protein [Planctomycetaceae bacterium]MCA9030718.1 hypothetical protein [Planctomycetaceae bacterium]MCA9043241.1 hypothetical protein [Planctomycetaceae bacterium]
MRRLIYSAGMLLALTATGCVGYGPYAAMPGFSPYGGCVDCDVVGGQLPPIGPMGPVHRLRWRLFQRDLRILHRRYPILSASIGMGGCAACDTVMNPCDPCGGMGGFDSCGCGTSFGGVYSDPMGGMSSYGGSYMSPSCSAPSCASPGMPSGPPMEPTPMGSAQYFQTPMQYSPTATMSTQPMMSATQAPMLTAPQPFQAPAFPTPTQPVTSMPQQSVSGPTLPSAVIQQSSFQTTAPF